MHLRLALPEQPVPQDPVGRANDAFRADKRPRKINLGIGVYTDATGRLPVLKAVRLANEALTQRGAAHAYLPIEGLPAFNEQVQALVLGADAASIPEGRAFTLQTLGGTGALALAARFLHVARPGAKVLVSDPTWDNHRAIFEAAGFDVRSHPYHDAAAHGVDIGGMAEALMTAPPGSVVVLHACCHNPTGMDLAPAQWDRVLDIVAARDLLPLCDLAYQGFGAGLAEDRLPLRQMEALGLEFLVASSLSKSMALYGERVGALTVVASSARQADAAGALLRRLVRSSYSNPPTHGAALASEVFNSAELRVIWEAELDAMRDRIAGMRLQLSRKLAQLAPTHDMSFITRQRGMFSYTGLSADAVTQLRVQDAVHLLDTGRLCLAALNPDNIDNVAQAMARALNGLA